MNRLNSKAAQKQAAYRAKVKAEGGFYLGVYIKGKAAHSLNAAKKEHQRSYTELVNQALLAQMFNQATPEHKQVLELEQKRSGGVQDYDWENFK